jgi:tetratricopeptide (TPR) repeat protein
MISRLLILGLSVATLVVGCNREKKETKEDFQAKVAKYTLLLEKNPTDTIALYNRGWYNLKLGYYGDAIADCDKLLEIAPSHADAYYMRGYARERLNQSPGSIRMALYDYRRAIQLAPPHVMALEALGCTFLENLEYDSAITYFSSLIAIDTTSAIAYCDRGFAYNLKSVLDSATNDCEKAMALNPQLAGAYELRGNLRFKSGNFRGSAQDYYRCISLSGDTATALAYCGLGAAEGKLGLTDNEISDYERSLTIDPTFRLSHYNLALALDYDRNEPTRAVVHYQKYLFYASDGDSVHAPFVRARLDSILRGSEAK